MDLTKEEYDYLKNFNWSLQMIEGHQQKDMLKIYNRVNNMNREMTSCSSCWRDILTNLKGHFDNCTLYTDVKKIKK